LGLLAGAQEGQRLQFGGLALLNPAAQEHKRHGGEDRAKQAVQGDIGGQMAGDAPGGEHPARGAKLEEDDQHEHGGGHEPFEQAEAAAHGGQGRAKAVGGGGLISGGSRYVRHSSR
jgi:hypothetical protein